MKVRVVAVGGRMPRWVDAGFAEYARRMPRACRLELVEVPAGRRTRGADLARLRAVEGERCLRAAAGSLAVGLAREGRSISTPELARRLARWRDEGRDAALLIGGPDGLDPACLGACDERWSLSALTLAHPVARVVVAEQLYRAWSIVTGHPYHRGER